MSFAAAPASTPVLRIEDGVATITLNRPAQRNRLENADLKALLAHFDTVNRDAAVRVLVLTANTSGQPRPVFCAGYDIGGFDEPGHGSTFFEEIPDALAALRPVTVCALNGSVYGGATDVVLACDLRIGLLGIEWRMPATALGLHYYPSGLQRYVSRFGLAATQRAFLTARPFTDRQLDALGLFEALVGPEEWAQTQQALVHDILALAPMAVQETKQSIREIETGRGDVSRMREREQRTSQSADFAEGRLAFAQRRKPVFTGC
ncbi:MAG: 2,3-dehydroadipyl-CoA hydratase [Pseudomonadota bacterium]